MGFGPKWCKWILEMLSSTRASVLVNGSPTKEFHIQIGLRQGDPLSPFLFILAMEGLHVAFKRARLADVFRGISIDDIEITHLLYANDFFVLSPWSLDKVVHILCFFDVFSWLRVLINLHKSKLIGIGVDSFMVEFAN